ncbi:MAG TPA: DUF2950 domain-containing protein [Candidatus Polarisedimenticolaceae bacterium]|nr:DUF2950 domain-containing protein [Candidatus Polarisedimenticolaceae bacterium]
MTRPRSTALCLGLALTIGCSSGPSRQERFATPEQAAEALVSAAERFDVSALANILGPEGIDLVVTEDRVQDRNQAQAFAAEARTQMRVERDPESSTLAVLSVGPDDWPLPIPLVEEGGGWRFDSEAGREEILNRRIGQNELDAIDICRGYAEAQHEYASEKHDGSNLHQYAQRIISTPGRHDGLAWQEPDGTWAGPVGEGIARVIAEGYTDRIEPYHGYYFKILKGQGPSAPLGAMDFRIKDVMIGGFALVAAPADYGVTGIMTFIVSHTGVVYEKDLGPETEAQFRAMELYDPDETWTTVEEL